MPKRSSPRGIGIPDLLQAARWHLAVSLIECSDGKSLVNESIWNYFECSRLTYLVFDGFALTIIESWMFISHLLLREDAVIVWKDGRKLGEDWFKCGMSQVERMTWSVLKWIWRGYNWWCGHFLFWWKDTEHSSQPVVWPVLILPLLCGLRSLGNLTYLKVSRA